MRGNLDVTAIYVEALMNLKAWQLWEKNTTTGEITPADDNTLLLVKILEDAFESSEEAKESPCTMPFILPRSRTYHHSQRGLLPAGRCTSYTNAGIRSLSSHAITH